MFLVVSVRLCSVSPGAFTHGSIHSFFVSASVSVTTCMSLQRSEVSLTVNVVTDDTAAR